MLAPASRERSTCSRTARSRRWLRSGGENYGSACRSNIKGKTRFATRSGPQYVLALPRSSQARSRLRADRSGATCGRRDACNELCVQATCAFVTTEYEKAKFTECCALCYRMLIIGIMHNKVAVAFWRHRCGVTVRFSLGYQLQALKQLCDIRCVWVVKSLVVRAANSE